MGTDLYAENKSTTSVYVCVCAFTLGNDELLILSQLRSATFVVLTCNDYHCIE